MSDRDLGCLLQKRDQNLADMQVESGRKNEHGGTLVKVFLCLESI